MREGVYRFGSQHMELEEIFCAGLMSGVSYVARTENVEGIP